MYLQECHSDVAGVLGSVAVFHLYNKSTMVWAPGPQILFLRNSCEPNSFGGFCTGTGAGLPGKGDTTVLCGYGERGMSSVVGLI